MTPARRNARADRHMWKSLVKRTRFFASASPANKAAVFKALSRVERDSVSRTIRSCGTPEASMNRAIAVDAAKSPVTSTRSKLSVSYALTT